jgi:signal transduction histidine kinase
MRLLAKYNRVNIAATSIVFVVGGLCYYFILQFVLLGQLDDDLKIEEQEIVTYVHVNNKLPDAANYPDQKTVFEQTALPVERKIQSKNIRDEEEGEYISTRRLVFPIAVSGKYYKVSVYKSQQETEDLIQLIVIITLSLVILLLLILFVINRFVLNKLWLPFNNTLEKLKEFNVNDKSVIAFDKNNINEFNELNDAVSTMSKRVLQDYEALKNFTENASHEIQTPLAVANSKLELLMQSENFTEGQMKDIETIQGEISRLSKLNQSLLLLTKIDNHQFQETGKVEIAQIILKQLDNYEELIAAKQIMLTKNIDTNTSVQMNETMSGVLISNLITNAIKHNIEHGTIDISLQDKLLTVQNTGAPLQSDPETLFERFKKDGTQSESLGLGLSIVKKICEQYNFKVLYACTNQLHTVSIHFP